MGEALPVCMRASMCGYQSYSKWLGERFKRREPLFKAFMDKKCAEAGLKRSTTDIPQFGIKISLCG